MNSISSNSSITNLTSVGSADDALDMQQTIQIVVTDKIRNSILARIDNTKNIGQRLLETNSFLTRLRETNPGNYQTITVDKFLSAKNNPTDLNQLLQSDGPKLGNSLISSQSFLAELNQLNLNIQTNIRYPVLMITLDKDNKVIQTEFSFMNQTKRDALESLEKSSIKDSNPIFDSVSEGDNPVTTRYESFDSFANLVPSLSDINSSISTLNTQRSSLQSEYAKELAVLSTSAKQIQDKLLNFQLFSKEDESRSRKMLEDRKSELNNAVNTFQLLKNFKEKNSDVNAKKIDSVDSNQKNKIDIENNVPISNAVFIKPDINLENNSKINFLNFKNSTDNDLNKNNTSSVSQNSESNLNDLSLYINDLALVSRNNNEISKNIISIKNELKEDKSSEASISNSLDLKIESVQAKEKFISNDKFINFNPNIILNKEVNKNDARKIGLTDSNKIVKNDVINKSDDNLNDNKLTSNSDYGKDSNNMTDSDSNLKK